MLTPFGDEIKLGIAHDPRLKKWGDRENPHYSTKSKGAIYANFVVTTKTGEVIDQKTSWSIFPR